MLKIINACLSLGLDDETIDRILDGYCRTVYGYSLETLMAAVKYSESNN